MSNSWTRWMHAALPIALGILLVACSHADPDAKALRSAGGGASSGSHSPADQNVPSQDDPSEASSTPGSTQDDPDDTADDDETPPPEEPKVPGGMLTYTIVFTGHSEVHTFEQKSSFDVSRRIQVTSRLKGMTAPGVVSTPTAEDLGRKLQACGNDSSCQHSVAMSFAFQRQAGLEQDVNRQLAALRRDRAWQSTDQCHGMASVDDKGNKQWLHWDQNLDGHVSLKGSQSFECKEVPPEFHFEGPALLANLANHTYTLTLSGFGMWVQLSSGNAAPRKDLMHFPGIVIKDVKFTSLDKPLSGSMTLHPGDGGNELYGKDSPIIAKVDWTFTPDAK